MADVSPITEVNGFFLDCAVQIVSPHGLTRFPGQSVPQGLQPEGREGRSRQGVLSSPLGF